MVDQRRDQRAEQRHDHLKCRKLRHQPAHVCSSWRTISASSVEPYSSLMRTASASPSASVATPTTMAVRISTCGNGFEYTAKEGSRIGGVPPMIFPGLMNRR